MKPLLDLYEMGPWAIGGPRFGGYAARWDALLGGDLPPRTGAAREAELLRKGRMALAHARRHYGRALTQTIALMGSRQRPWRPLSLRYSRVVGEQIVNDQHRWRNEVQTHIRGVLQKMNDLGQDISEIYDAERNARRSLALAVAAYNYLEDTPWAEPMHEFAHQVGAFVNGLFCCPLVYEDGAYWRECPLAMMHLRFGLSPEFVSRQLCSICGLDVGDCLVHVGGETYPVVAQLVDEEVCSVCWRDACPNHVIGHEYPVKAYIVMPDFRADKLAMVDRPRDPLARLARFEFPMQFLENRLGYQPVGEPHECFYCIEPCKGMFTSDSYRADGGPESFAPAGYIEGSRLLTLTVGH